jgi:hypothetical protein
LPYVAVAVFYVVLAVAVQILLVQSGRKSRSADAG